LLKVSDRQNFAETVFQLRRNLAAFMVSRVASLHQIRVSQPDPGSNRWSTRGKIWQAAKQDQDQMDSDAD
jgi:hypothetical protein